VTPTPALVNQQVIRIYDTRGELVRLLNGVSAFRSTDVLTLSLSAFVPTSPQPGGSLNIEINGQVIGTWNALDNAGNVVPNGIYHIVVEEHFPDGTVMILAQNASVDPFTGQETAKLVAAPNMAHPGDPPIHFTASYAGTPADGRSQIKIYSLDGELVNELSVAGGTATWDLTTQRHEPIASGLYLAVLDGIDPMSGQHLTKTAKILYLQ
jgi:hypothetical protein